jgi:hypothetical protein
MNKIKKIPINSLKFQKIAFYSVFRTTFARRLLEKNPGKEVLPRLFAYRRCVFADHPIGWNLRRASLSRI